MSLRNALWRTPDPLLAAAGVRGEVLVAKIRLFLTALLLLIPLINSLLTLEPQEARVALALTATAFVLSVAAYVLVRRGFTYPWIGFLTSAFDVTLVSAGLAIFLRAGPASHRGQQQGCF
jgi:two-component system cell cycle response regulator